MNDRVSQTIAPSLLTPSADTSGTDSGFRQSTFGKLGGNTLPGSLSSPSLTDAAAAGAGSAGQLLRQARQAQGMHVAALAAAIKVTPAKLEALEAERFDLLPDPTFARALALAVCRYLKVDPEPIMSKLPQPRAHRLEHINRGLATPFRDHAMPRDDGGDWYGLLQPAVVGPILVLIAALVVYLVPVNMWKLPAGLSGNASTPVAGTGTGASILPPDASPSAPDEPTPAGGTMVEAVRPATGTSPQAPGAVVGAADSVAAAPAGPSTTTPAAGTAAAAPLTITATRESWVEVVDGQGRTLVSRSIPAGETVDLDGPAPLKLRIGNAQGTQVTFKGQTVSLASSTRDNIAKLELR